MDRLDPRIEESPGAALEAIARRGELLSTDRLQESYGLFRDQNPGGSMLRPNLCR